mgnify:CR=1 FL=1
MKVSVITIYYNREDYVEESIRSLLNQTYTDMEIIVVDDGSTDRTYQKLLEFSDPRLKVYTHSNRGFVKSIIEAIQMSTGELIAIHGSGDISLPRRIEKQVEVMQQYPNVGVVGCYIDELNMVSGQRIYRRPYISDKTNLTDQIIRSNPFTQGEVMFRRDVYEKVGGYRDFFRYSQDRDLWLRMSLVTDFYIIKEVLYHRFTLPGGVSRTTDKVVMQKYFADLACQCIELRRNGMPDLIEQYGIYAPFYRQRSSALAWNLFLQSIHEWMNGEITKAKYINQLSINEKIRLYNVLQSINLYFLSKSSTLNRLMKKILFKAGYGARKERQC